MELTVEAEDEHLGSERSCVPDTHAAGAHVHPFDAIQVVVRPAQSVPGRVTAELRASGEPRRGAPAARIAGWAPPGEPDQGCPDPPATEPEVPAGLMTAAKAGSTTRSIPSSRSWVGLSLSTALDVSH
jgi:hypothetical protein